MVSKGFVLYPWVARNFTSSSGSIKRKRIELPSRSVSLSGCAEKHAEKPNGSTWKLRKSADIRNECASDNIRGGAIRITTMASLGKWRQTAQVRRPSIELRTWRWARLHVTAVPILILLAACAHDTRGSRADTAGPPATQAASAPAVAKPAPAVEPQSAPQPAAAVSAPATESGTTRPGVPTVAPAMPTSPASPSQSGYATAKTPPSNQAITPHISPTSPIPSTSTAPTAASPPSRAPVATAPPLDLNGLEQRLRDTHAIGVFTKLSLKNQVDDLLAQFKAFHQGRSRITLGQLRQKYELMLMKVVSLLKDGDPALANTVFSSREAIWGVLTDPEKFAAM